LISADRSWYDKDISTEAIFAKFLDQRELSTETRIVICCEHREAFSRSWSLVRSMIKPSSLIVRWSKSKFYVCSLHNYRHSSQLYFNSQFILPANACSTAISEGIANASVVLTHPKNMSDDVMTTAKSFATSVHHQGGKYNELSIYLHAITYPLDRYLIFASCAQLHNCSIVMQQWQK